jgi:hypothetical protein
VKLLPSFWQASINNASSLWYPRANQAMRVAIFFSAATVAGMLMIPSHYAAACNSYLIPFDRSFRWSIGVNKFINMLHPNLTKRATDM